MNLKHRFTILLTIWLGFLSGPLCAQNDPEFNPVGFSFLDYKEDFPDNLLTSRTAVLMLVPDTKDHQRGDWKSMASFSHKAFRSVGIDPVAYFNIQDIMAGREVRYEIAEFLKKREIKNLIWVGAYYVQERSRRTLRFTIVITHFNGKESYMDDGSEAWRYQGRDLEAGLKEMIRQIQLSKLERKNFLITEEPEFFSGKSIIDGVRYEIYQSDLKIDDIVIHPFEEIGVSASRPGGTINDSINSRINKYNASVPARNARLTEILEHYPFEFYMGEPGINEEDIDRKGYQYVLYKLHTTGYSIRKMLDYPVDESETDYLISRYQNGTLSLERVPVHTVVHKYYVKHLVTGNVFIGSKWDADLTWDQALLNFIENMKAEIKR